MADITQVQLEPSHGLELRISYSCGQTSYEQITESASAAIAHLKAALSSRDEEIRRKDELIASLRRVKSEEEARIQRMAERLANQDEQIAELRALDSDKHEIICAHERKIEALQEVADAAARLRETGGPERFDAMDHAAARTDFDAAIAKARALGALKEE